MLVVAGENDFIPVDAQRAYSERLGVRFELMSGAGHTPNTEQPEELTAVLVPFWEATYGARREPASPPARA
jgi:pimeloyl-ACP methyl ester carboxylesterase